MSVPFKIVKVTENTLTPCYRAPAAAGFDIAAVDETVVHPYNWNGVYLVRTGIQCAFPVGYELQIRQRSGLSLKYPNYIANGVGTIDADYRGEIFISIINWTDKPWLILPGDRIAQGVVSPIVQVKHEDMTTRTGRLPATVRGKAGFGST